MRGYNIDPLLLIDRFSKEKEIKSIQTNASSPNKKELRKETNDEVKKEIKSPPLNQRSEKNPVLLNYYPSNNNRIAPSTAWIVAIVLLLVVLIISIMDARSRITRLETMLFSMLAHQHRNV